MSIDVSSNSKQLFVNRKLRSVTCTGILVWPDCQKLHTRLIRVDVQTRFFQQKQRFGLFPSLSRFLNLEIFYQEKFNL